MSKIVIAIYIYMYFSERDFPKELIKTNHQNQMKNKLSILFQKGVRKEPNSEYCIFGRHIEYFIFHPISMGFFSRNSLN
jgi:hypothetical protein